MPNIVFGQINADISIKNVHFCGPSIVEFINNSSSGDNIIYQWDFGKSDASLSVSTEKDSKQIYYDKAGEYTVSLIAFKKGVPENADTATVSIYLHNLPKADFLSDKISCAPSEFILKQSAVPADTAIVDYEWFIDGEYFNEPDPVATINLPGTYQAVLQVRDLYGCESTTSKTFTLLEKPIANFNIRSNGTCTPPFEISFENRSSAIYPLTYEWKWENELLSSKEKPSNKIVEDYDQYSVSLTAKGESNNCHSTYSQKVDLTDLGANIEVFKNSSASGEKISNGQTVPRGVYTINNGSVSGSKFKWLINGHEYFKHSITETFCEDTLVAISLISGIGSFCPDTSKFSFTISPALNNNFLFINESDTVHAGETAQNMDALLVNPYSATESKWVAEQQQYSGKAAKVFICGTGEQRIILYSNYNNKCVDTISRTIITENRMAYDYSIFHRGNEISEGDTVCTDEITFKHNSHKYTSYWDYFDESAKDPTTYKITFCEEKTNTVNLITQYNNYCTDTLPVSIYNTKCYQDDFKVYRHNASLVNFKDPYRNCIGDYKAVPDSGTNFIIWKIGQGRHLDKYHTLDSVFYKSKDSIFTFRIDSSVTKIKMASRIEENGCIDTVTHSVILEPHIFNYEINDLSMGCPYPFIGQISADDEEMNLYWEIGNEKTFEEDEPAFRIDGKIEKIDAPSKAYVATETIVAVIEGNCIWRYPKSITKKIPASRMEAFPSEGCVPLTVQFDDDSRQVSVDSSIISYTWIWGDGTSESYRNQTQNDQLSIFTDCINADTVLSDSKKNDILLLMNSTPDELVQVECIDSIAYFNKISDCECISNKKTNFYTSYLQLFNAEENRLGCIAYTEAHSGKSPVHTYSEPGNYTAKLIIEGNDGCSDTASVEIRVGQKVDATVTVSADNDTLSLGDNLNLSFDSYLVDDWDFSQNVNNLTKPCGTNSQSIPLNGYEYGEFNTGFTVYNNGCPSNATVELAPNLANGLFLLPWYFAIEDIDETVKNGNKGVCDPNIGTYGTLSAISDGCNNQFVNFEFKPSSRLKHWNFDLGDGTIVSDKKTFVHEYDSGGFYNIAFIEELSNPENRIGLKTIFVSGKVKAHITLTKGDTVTCSDREITLSAKESSGYAETSFEPFLWYIDGIPKKRTWKDTASFKEFDKLGIHEVMLVAYDQNRCADSAYISIRTTKPAPDFEFVKDHLCAPSDNMIASVLFNDQSIKKWKWGYEGTNPEDTIYREFGNDTTLEVRFNANIARTREILMIAQDTTGCVDTIKHSITQYAPKASFSQKGDACAGVPLGLIDKSSNADSASWFSTNGIISTDGFPQVTFPQRGEFEVGMIAYSHGNCLDTAYHKIVTQDVDARFTASKDFICRNDEITFTQLTITDSVKNKWVFSESQFKTQLASSPTPINNQYTSGGTFNVSLTATTSHGCTDTYSSTVEVLSAKPSISDRSLCKGDTAFFINPHGFADSYEYDFGNGIDTTVYSNAQLATQYNQRGDYTITVKAHSKACSDTYTQKMISVQEADASFTVSDSIVCNFYPPGEIKNNFIQFTHTNIPDPIAYGAWSFTDNQGSKPYQSPQAAYNYTVPGVVNSSLEITTTYGCVDKKEKKIVVNGTLGDFRIDHNEICIHDEVGFYPIDFVNVDSLTWIFDDGLVSTDMTPKHAYHEKGTVAPILKLYDTTGCLNIIGPKPISVYEVIAGFNIGNSIICEHDTLQITDNSLSTTNWLWDFGNGDIRLEQEPADYAYHKAGSYTILLTASNHIGCTDTATAEIEVLPVPDPEFGINKEFLCASADELLLEYIASDTSIVDFVWSFGDSNRRNTDGSVYYNFDESSRMDSSLTHVYESESNIEFTIALAATDFRGCKNRAEKQIKLFAPHAQFTITDPLGCKGEAVEIVNKSSTADSVIWQYGDGSTESALTDVAPVYSKRGNYTVTATAYKKGRCTDTLTAEVNIEEIDAQFAISDNYICDDDSILFTHLQIPDSVFGTWMFSQSNSAEYTLASDSVQWFTYGTGGTYQVTLELETENGCKDSFSDTVLVNEAMPVFNDTTICAGNTIEVDNITGLAEKYIWDFGNGQTDTLTTNGIISVNYPSRGNYTVSLIAYHKGCSDTVVLADAINVQEIDARFSMSDTLACDEEYVRFTHLSAPDSVFGSWSFGNGDMINYLSSADSAVEHSYSDGGSYIVQLQLSTTNGCEMAVAHEIAVNKAKPVISDKTICKNDIIQLHNKTAEAQKYIWIVPGVDTLENDNNTISDLHFPQRGTYSLTLIAEHPSCTDTIQLDSIIVVEEINADFNLSDEMICNVYPDSMDQKNLILMTHLYYPDSITSGQWMLNGTPIQQYATADSVYSSYQHLINNLGENTLSLAIATANGCKDTLSKMIWVNGTEGEFSISKDSICKGEAIDFTVNNLEQVERLEWVYGDGKRSNKENHTYRYDTIGDFTPYLILFDSTGCINPLIQKSIYINEVVADFEIPDPQLCIGEELNLIDKSKMTTKWNWDLGNNTTQNRQTPHNVSYTHEGRYTVQLISFDDIMCSDTIAKNVTVYPHPEISLEAVELVCLDSTATITALYDERNTISWFKNGTAFEGNTPQISDPYIRDTSSYHAEIIDSLGCKNTDEIRVNIRPYPIYLQNLTDTFVLIGEEVALEITSNYRSDYIWEPDVNVLEMNTNRLVVQALQSTIYSVVVSDTCHSQEFTYSVNMVPISEIPCRAALPNAFSPNNDRKNDILKIRGWGLKKLEYFRIYNRLGEMVFETTELSEGWDGTFRSQPQGIETYTYHFSAETYCGDNIEQKGYVDLIR